MAMLGYLYIYQDGRTVGLQLFEWESWDPKTQIYPPRRPAEKVDQSIVGPAEDRLPHRPAIVIGRSSNNS